MAFQFSSMLLSPMGLVHPKGSHAHKCTVISGFLLRSQLSLLRVQYTPDIINRRENPLLVSPSLFNQHDLS